MQDIYNPKKFNFLQVYRTLGPAQNTTDRPPTCTQIYFYGQDEQLTWRIDRLTGARNAMQLSYEVEIFQNLQILLMEVNPYLASFFSVSEQIHNGILPQDVQIMIHADKKPSEEHTRRFNLPQANEIAVLIPNEPHADRAIICSFRNQTGTNEELR